MRYFCTAGPIKPEDHYYIPGRLNEQEINSLIEQKKYFILHAPRQSGKTTALLQLVKDLNAEGMYEALYVNVEPAQASRSRVIEGLHTIMDLFASSIKITFGQDHSTMSFFQQIKNSHTVSGNELFNLLEFWAKHTSKPIVLFIDEIDSLVGDTLISVLRQLRAGYTNRPEHFPQSVCLVGVRDVRDYRIWSDEKQAIVLGGSAFNIKAKSLTIPAFTPKQVSNLYKQHTKETGQKFTADAIKYAFEQTQGQPWLVNALAYEACFEMVTDRKKSITAQILMQAREILIRRRDTHLDVLVDKLREPRVRAIIDAVLTSKETPEDFPTDDIQYVIDLGIIIRREGSLVIANPIYQEILPLELTYSTQTTITQQASWYTKRDGSLNMQKLFVAFTQFYRENSAIWLEKFDYKEAGPHLLLMAFLQRIINGGGSINREYALGTGRLDLLICWKKQRIVIEVKVWQSKEKTLTKGLKQTAKYMDTSDATEGHLVIFDRAKDKSWDEKIYHRQEKIGKYVINVWGM